MQEAKKFYESLYTSITDKVLSDEYDDIFFPENSEAKLTDDQKLSCEGELSAAECFGRIADYVREFKFDAITASTVRRRNSDFIHN